MFTEIHILGNLEGKLDDLTEYNIKTESSSDSGEIVTLDKRIIIGG